MQLDDALLTTTLPVRHPKDGLYYLPLQKAIRDKLRISEGCLVEVAIMHVYSPPTKEEEKED